MQLQLVCHCRMPFVGFKALPSGYAGTNPWSVKESADTQNASAKAVAGGLYTWWQVSAGRGKK